MNNSFERGGESVFGETPENMLRAEFKRLGNIGFEYTNSEWEELGFTKEALEALVEQGLLEADAGGYSPTDKFYESALPG
jgi:hypothetical protein